MKHIDVLGPSPKRHQAFSGELLSEADDEDLDQIVKNAARSLNTPIALVSLVLDQIQFFKAQYGLPSDLAAARGTRRDVSFCQFVVRDGKAFEVTDAAQDPRLPQYLVEQYKIKSYLGIPIHVGDTVAGSLCVIDTNARSFTKEERQALEQLAQTVDERIKCLSESRRQTRLELTQEATGKATSELRRLLSLLRRDVEAEFQGFTAIRSFMRLASHVQQGGEVSSSLFEQSLATAKEAIDSSEDTFYDVFTTAGDCMDNIVALENLVTHSSSTSLSEIAMSAQDLARHVTEKIGGMPLPEFTNDPIIYTPRPLAVALLSTTLITVANRLKEFGIESGIKLQTHVENGAAELEIHAERLPSNEIVAELCEKLGSDPTIRIRSVGGALHFAFRAISTRDES